MQSIIAKILLITGGIFGSIFGGQSANTTQIPDAQNPDVKVSLNSTENISGTGEVLGASTSTINKKSIGDKIYTDAQLLKMATPKLITLTLGDNKYSTSVPKVGYIYLCNVNKDNNQGAGTDGPWITGTTWLPNQKAHVDGNVSWSNSWFKNNLSGVKRLFTGNNLPINHTTGTFPISGNSTAGHYDRNPNSIKTQNMSYSLTADPVYNATPNCMGGESGVMLSGVPMFNGFDAQQRDAQAHEVQDNCDGHPQEKGEYHYHGLSSCFKDMGETKVLGYALDGFPITGPLVGKDKYLTTNNLDVCHGLTSTIIVDGKSKTTYHYVLTQDFPYSVSCFRGTPSKISPGLSLKEGNSAQGQIGNTPPQPAIDACKNKSDSASCTVQTPNGSLSGNCKNTPDGKYFACIPAGK